MNFRAIYESAKKEREQNLREDNASYKLGNPVAGLQPTKKADHYQAIHKGWRLNMGASLKKEAILAQSTRQNDECNVYGGCGANRATVFLELGLIGAFRRFGGHLHHSCFQERPPPLPLL
ncbi:MAG: hypothetical protein LBK73_06850 [Treponema sp.]|jgi:hypothetical protein|nr:hypothetical protein [Treponema sp.]